MKRCDTPELKLQAEQDAQRMVFELDRERQQAAQRKLEAEASATRSLS